MVWCLHPRCLLPSTTTIPHSSMSASTADAAKAPAATTAAAADDDVPQPLPNLALQQLHFAILSPRTEQDERKQKAEELLKGIEADGECCERRCRRRRVGRCTAREARRADCRRQSTSGQAGVAWQCNSSSSRLCVASVWGCSAHPSSPALYLSTS